MLLEEKVQKRLEGLEIVDPKVRIIKNYGLRILAQVVSPSFETMDEGDRQVFVWGKLLDDLPDRESLMVEFVYTDSPSEIAEAEAADSDSR
jgi:hypothetical protein